MVSPGRIDPGNSRLRAVHEHSSRVAVKRDRRLHAPGMGEDLPARRGPGHVSGQRPDGAVVPGGHRRGSFEENAAFALLMAVGGLIGTVLGTITARLLGYDESRSATGSTASMPPWSASPCSSIFKPTVLAILLSRRMRGLVRSSRGRCGRYLPFPTYTSPFIVTTWVLLGVGTLMGCRGSSCPPRPRASTSPRRSPKAWARSFLRRAL